jgi:uncharacterized membrane protein
MSIWTFGLWEQKKENDVKKQSVSSGLGKAVVVGAITGIRSTAGLKQIFDQSKIVKIIALFESVGDKLPFTPARTQVVSLLARAGLGGFAAALFDDKRRERLLLAAVGATSAIGFTIAITRIRTRLGEKSRVAGTAFGFAEDGAVACAGRILNAA